MHLSTIITPVLLSVLLFFAQTDGEKDPPPDYDYLNFHIGDEQLSYAGAASACQDLGMKLAEIREKTDQIELMGFLLERDEFHHRYWIGGNRLSGPWIWGADGPNITFTYWGPKQPNNWKGNQKCIATLKDTIKWDDEECNKKMYYVCQVEEASNIV